MPQRDPLARRMKLFEHHRVATVLDVGANQGQYGRELRRGGYRGEIVSFEPLSQAFETLRAACRHDSHWQCFRMALGDREGTADINISANSQSSSLLAMLARHREVAPQSRYVGKEQVQIRTLDAFLTEHDVLRGPSFLKIDAQGYERFILDGAQHSLDRMDGLQLELALTPLYRGEARMDELVTRVRHLGFELVSVEPGFVDLRTGRQLQVDGIFFRSPSA